MNFDGSDEIIVDNSRFIGFVKFDFKPNELNELINFLRKKYKRHSHICYAYKVMENNIEYKKYTDDGEPKGSAGRPILSAIENYEYNNILVIIVRCFGGKKLGSSKLLRTYRKIANDTILKSAL